MRAAADGQSAFLLVKEYMRRTLIIGYGNIDRSDDGVAQAIINLVRQRLGQKILNEDETGLENIGGEIDSIFLPQLLPEIMEQFIGYEQIIFVDAHAGEELGDLNLSPVVPQYVTSTFTHHLTPATFLAFMKSLYCREPVAYIVSVRGHDFDFQRSLSPQTRALMSPAANQILHLLKK